MVMFSLYLITVPHTGKQTAALSEKQETHMLHHIPALLSAEE